MVWLAEVAYPSPQFSLYYMACLFCAFLQKTPQMKQTNKTKQDLGVEVSNAFICSCKFSKLRHFNYIELRSSSFSHSESVFIWNSLVCGGIWLALGSLEGPAMRKLNWISSLHWVGMQLCIPHIWPLNKMHNFMQKVVTFKYTILTAIWKCHWNISVNQVRIYWFRSFML